MLDIYQMHYCCGAIITCRMLDMGEVDSSAAPAGVKKPGLVGTLKPVVMASYACIKEDEYGELDEAEAAITAAVDMNREPSFSNGPVIRIVAADQRTADRVETEVRERLDELFTSATVTKPVVKLYNTITREYRSSSACKFW